MRICHLTANSSAEAERMSFTKRTGRLGMMLCLLAYMNVGSAADNAPNKAGLYMRLPRIRAVRNRTVSMIATLMNFPMRCGTTFLKVLLCS